MGILGGSRRRDETGAGREMEGKGDGVGAGGEIEGRRRGRREGKEERDRKCWKTGKAHEATKICVRHEIDLMASRRGR